MKRFVLIALALTAGGVSAALVDCADESAFAVIGRAGDTGLAETAKTLEKAIAAREGRVCRSVEVLALPADAQGARQAIFDFGARIRKDAGVKRVGTLATPEVYGLCTNLFAYDFRRPADAAKSPLGGARRADVRSFAPGDELTDDVMNFVCGYPIDTANPVCSFESGEPSLTAAEAVAAMEAGDWVDAEVAKTRARIDAWRGADEVVLVAFECDLHVYSPERGRWPTRVSLLEGSFRHVRRFACAAQALKADVAADLGDLGYDYSGRHWKDACRSERAARMALQRAGYDLFTIPFMALQGNHDRHWDRLEDFGGFFNPPGVKRTEGFVFGPTRGYSTYDIPAKRTRLLFVNTSEGGTGGHWEIRPGQVDWMRQAVASTPEGWTVAFFSHDCLHRTAGDENWKERPGCKASKTYGELRALFESIAAGGRLKFAGAYCGDSHMNRLHEDKGVKYFVCDASFRGKGPKNLLVHVAAINVRTGEGRLFRIGARGAKGDL